MLNKLAKTREIIHVLDVNYRDLFKTPLGQIVLDDLRGRYIPDKITTNDPHTTAMNARSVEIINYIQRRIDDGVDGKST
jgi:hypothetical protein